MMNKLPAYRTYMCFFQGTTCERPVGDILTERLNAIAIIMKSPKKISWTKRPTIITLAPISNASKLPAD
jgi:hypothetical protein